MENELKGISLQSKKFEKVQSPIARTMETIKRKLRGLYNYYGINGNFKGIMKFYKYYKYEYLKILRHRGQKNPIKYEDYLRIWKYYITERPNLKVNIWY